MNIDDWCKDYAHRVFNSIYEEQESERRYLELENRYLQDHPDEPPFEEEEEINPYELLEADSNGNFWRSLLLAFLDYLPNFCIVAGLVVLIFIGLGVL